MKNSCLSGGNRFLVKVEKERERELEVSSCGGCYAYMKFLFSSQNSSENLIEV